MITRRANDRSIASFQHGFIDQNLEPIVESQRIADLENSLVEPIDQTIVVREFVGHRQNVSNVVEFEVTTFGQGEKPIVSPMDPLSGVTRRFQLFQDANDLHRTNENDEDDDEDLTWWTLILRSRPFKARENLSVNSLSSG